MSKVYQNECSGCASPGYPCDGSHKKVAHYFCDKCKQEFDAIELYVTKDGDFCEQCILNEYETIAQAEQRGAYDYE